MTEDNNTPVLSEEERLKKEKKEKKALEKQKRLEEKKLREKEKKKQKKAEKKQSSSTQQQQQKKVSELGLTAQKEDNFADWFTQVITKSEMIEYYDVSGCYILRPLSYEIWEQIKSYIDGVIKGMGVKNAMFPLFVTKGALEREQDHVEGFSAEVAWVTKSGKSDLAEPLAIRPTSETIMYPAYSKWIRSHRDLPLKLNQWTNVVRWEFKHAVPFIRSREFLWQEGHTAFETLEQATEEVYQILDMYRAVYEDLLAVPVIKGQKSESEKFAGGFFTTSVEAFIPANGRAVQGATSHCLGQNFSKMFDIQFESDTADKQKQYVWQNSWGLTTRTIGVMMMVHGDNHGANFPPRVAPTQIVVIPVLFKDANIEQLNTKAKEIYQLLSGSSQLRVEIDDRDYKTPGWKYSYWEMRGVPVRIEIGPRDLENQTASIVKRHNREKFTVPLSDVTPQKMQELLDTIQKEMFEKAKKERDERVKKVLTWSDFMHELNQKNMCIAPWCDQKECEHEIKERSKKDSTEVASELTSSAKSLCIPLEQQPLDADQKCVNCENKAKKWTLFGRSY